MSLFSRFYGTLFKSLCRVNQSLILRNLGNVTLNSCSRAHIDQIRNSPSKRFHIADMKIYKIYWKKVSDEVLSLKIYCPSNCTLHSTPDVTLGSFRKFSEQLSLRATLDGCFCQDKVC